VREFTVTTSDVLSLAAWLAVAIAVAVVVYRGMQRPRLRLVHGAAGWRTNGRDLLLYAVTAPVLVAFWFLFFVVILLVGTNDLGGNDVLRVSMAVVIASRFLAHVWREPAHELAKTVPLTLAALVIIAGGLRSQTSLEDVLTQVFETGVSGVAWLVLLFVDYLFTAVWYWVGVRWWTPRGHRVPGVPAAATTAD
jgi:hypothetical protein